MLILPGHPLKGTVSLPGDKSISHRAALFAALAAGESVCENFLIAGVTQRMLDAIAALGVSWRLDGTTLRVGSCGLQNLHAPAEALHCGNSGTTMRLLAGAIAAAGIPAVLDGSAGLRSRPMDRIVDPLRKMGVQISAREGRYAPLQIGPARTGGLQAADFDLPVASAQVKTCLLIAALAADGSTTINEPGPSRDHTERILAGMGVDVRRQANPREAAAPENAVHFRTVLTPSQKPLRPLALKIPGDFSSAAFLIVAALITPGSQVTLKDIGLNPTRTGLLDALETMGARLEISNYREVHQEPMADLTVRHSSLQGTQISGPLVVRMIDEFPVFAVAAAFASGPTTVSQAGELRFKESDRIHTLCEQLGAVGVPVREKEDGFIIFGDRPPAGGVVEPHGDHRLAMALATAGLAAGGPISILDPQIIHESFPGFRSTLEDLGAVID